MNIYAHDLSLFDFNVSGPFDDSLSHRFLTPAPFFQGEDDDYRRHISYGRDGTNYAEKKDTVSMVYPPHRHDGRSPLPLGMDWSAPPRQWEGRNTAWPHDPRTGWSFCVTVPSWVDLPKSSVSDPAVFYRVQVAVQSPDGITSARLILRRFNDFLELHSSIKKEFVKKSLPQVPPKNILRMKNLTLLEEVDMDSLNSKISDSNDILKIYSVLQRRCSLEDWMNILLSDIDISRSAPVATLLELEAAVRSYFSDEYQETEDTSNHIVPPLPTTSSDIPCIPSTSIDRVNDFADETSYASTMKHAETSLKNLVSRNSTSEDNVTDWHELITELGLLNKSSSGEKIECLSSIDGATETGTVTGGDISNGVGIERLDKSEKTYQGKTLESNITHVNDSVASSPGGPDFVNQGSMDNHDEAHGNMYGAVGADTESQKGLAIVFQSEERHKLKRVIDMLKQRLETAKADLENLILRLNQELAVRKFLSTKVKDLEVELETTRESCKQGMEKTVLDEKERFTQIQWDMEELRKQCMDMESLLNSIREEKAQFETTNQSLVLENQMLLQQISDLRVNFENLHKEHKELEVKSKAKLKVLVKEVKSLRTTQSELRQELSPIMKEKLEMERFVQREKERDETAKTTSKKLLHECDVLQNRLQECNVKFHIEEENKLIMDSSSPSEAIKLLATSDNRIGLLIAETQLLSEEVEKLKMTTSEEHRGTDDIVWTMLTEVLIENARLRKQVNSILRCSLSGHGISIREYGTEEEEVLL